MACDEKVLILFKVQKEFRPFVGNYRTELFMKWIRKERSHNVVLVKNSNNIVKGPERNPSWAINRYFTREFETLDERFCSGSWRVLVKKCEKLILLTLKFVHGYQIANWNYKSFYILFNFGLSATSSTSM